MDALSPPLQKFICVHENDDKTSVLDGRFDVGTAPQISEDILNVIFQLLGPTRYKASVEDGWSGFTQVLLSAKARDL